MSKNDNIDVMIKQAVFEPDPQKQKDTIPGDKSGGFRPGYLSRQHPESLRSRRPRAIQQNNRARHKHPHAHL